jgi:hypothetical protein
MINAALFRSEIVVCPVVSILFEGKKGFSAKLNLFSANILCGSYGSLDGVHVDLYKLAVLICM